MRMRGRALLAVATVAMTVAVSGCSSEDAVDGTGPDPAAAGSAAESAAASTTPSPAVSPGGAGTSVAHSAFAGTTPCDGVTRPLPQIPPGATCELATWRVELATDGTYTLAATYGMSEKNATGIRGGGTRVDMAGTWAERAGVLKLDTDAPALSVSFLRVGTELLHLLDRDGRLLGDDGRWSYTLNAASGSKGSTSIVTSSYDEPGSPGGGVFEGRTPCAAQLKPFAENPGPTCTRLTWRLTFRQDAAGKPAGYVSGVVGRAGSTTGTWHITRDLPGHAEAVVYRLRPGTGTGELALLLLGGRHLFVLYGDSELLVGDGLWSYTLSRTD